MKRLFTFYLLPFALQAIAQTPVYIQEDLLENGDWVGDMRITHVLNGDGTIASRLQQFYGISAWENSTLNAYAYDANGLQLTDLARDWDPLTQSWNDQWQNNYTYAANGLLTERVKESWSTSLQTWVNTDRSLYTYDANDAPQTISGQVWEVSQWENSSLVSYTYDGNGDLISQVTQVADANGDLVNTQRIDNTYDGSGNIVFAERQAWNNAWTPEYRWTNVYTVSDQLAEKTEEGYFNGSWHNLYRWLYTYDVNDMILTREWDESWNGDWNGITLDHYYYNPDGSVDWVLTQMRDTVADFWFDYGRTVYTYPEELTTEEVSGVPLSVFPNPATDRLTVVSDNVETAHFSVTDLAGRERLSVIATGTLHSLDIKELPAGVYLLLVTAEGKQSVRRFIKS